MNQSKRWGLGVLLLFVVSVGGCIDFQGIHRPRDDGQSTTAFRFETEFIPNAVLVRESTLPTWQLGRHAFKRGADRLLVISRVTSFGDPLTKGQIRRGVVPKLYDQILERVWISLELGVQVGEELNLDELQQKFRIGYDEGPIDGEMYIQPNRVLGLMTLIEEGPDSVVIDINMRVEPIRLPPWTYVGTVSIPVTPSGVRAKRLEERDLSVAALDKLQPQTESVSDEPVGQPDAVAEEAPLEQPPATQPDDETNDGADVPPLTAKELVGQWICERGDGSGHDTKYEYYLQFELDGRYVYTDQRPGYHPMAKWGDYQVKGKYLVLHVTRYTTLNDNNDHMRFLKSRYSTARIRRDGTGFTLEGAIAGRGSIFKGAITSFSRSHAPRLPMKDPVPFRDFPKNRK